MHASSIDPRSRTPLALALLSLIFVIAVFVYVVRHAEPLARHRIVEDLESKLHCEVELDQVHLRLRHGLEVNGSGLRIMAIGNSARVTPGGVPMLSVRSFQFTTTLLDLFVHHASAITAYAQGLVLTIPPADDREHLQQGDPSKHNQPRNSFFLNKLVATDSRLVLELPILKSPSSRSPSKLIPESAPKQPIEFDFNKLVLIDPGKNLPFIYEAILTNPKPVGEVHSAGHVGPWVFNAARKTPVDGNYTFDHADLSTVPGIAGTLSSVGRVSGVLGQMAVHGTTETPDFALDISAHPFPVHTEFQALVDGTTGNVALQAVAARFLHTSLNANGLISRAHDVPGHQIGIDVHLLNGRAEDLLTLFSRSSHPFVSAAISLTGHVDVPPGKQRLILKLHSEGRAALAGATWSIPSIQQKVDALSMRAEDHAREAKDNPSANPRVASTITGRFVIQRGAIDIAGLVYKIPGAVVLGAGQYPLINRDLAFHGVARTVASAAHMETGIKSLLLRPISPFLSKNGAGMQIPVSFTGDKAHPAFALDFKNRAADDQLTSRNHTKPQ